VSRQSRYERVHRVRQIGEQRAREEFLTCERIARHAEELALAMQAEVERARQELCETRLQRRVPPHELLTAQATLEALDRSLVEQHRRARELAATADGLRAAWERSRADERSLGRLIEREVAAERAEDLLREARALDERAARRPQGTHGAHGAAPAPQAAPAPATGEARGAPPSSPETPAADERDTGRPPR
jgi:flagellar export protein FliJ